MHHLRKKKAMDTYSPMNATVSKEQIVVDGYTPEEADEILAAITGKLQDNPSAVKESVVDEAEQAPEPEIALGDMVDFEEWAVTTSRKVRLDENMDKVFDTVIEKKGSEPVRVTRIEKRQADVLNAQVENTKKYFYPKSK